MLGQTGARASLPFHAVNHHADPHYQPGLQRHHLLPRQILSQRCFGPMIAAIGRECIGFDDFRRNGLLLPASEPACARLGLPLHRGPHRSYNAMVIERVGQVEQAWAAMRPRGPDAAHVEAVQRLRLLQSALRRRLLEPGRRPLSLNRHDRLGSHRDFSGLDALVDALWPATAAVPA